MSKNTIILSNETMKKLAKLYHAKSKAVADYEQITNEIKASVDTSESVTIGTKNNGIMATVKVAYQFDKAVLSDTDAKRIAELEKEIKAIKSKYENTKKVVSITNIR